MDSKLLKKVTSDDILVMPFDMMLSIIDAFFSPFSSSREEWGCNEKTLMQRDYTNGLRTEQSVGATQESKDTMTLSNSQ